MIATIEKLEIETIVNVNKTFHYKLKPTKAQEIVFSQ